MGDAERVPFVVGHPRGARELWADTFLLPRGKLHHGIAPGDPQPVDPPDYFQNCKCATTRAEVSPALCCENSWDQRGTDEGKNLSQSLKGAIDFCMQRADAPIFFNARKPKIARTRVTAYETHWATR